MCSLPLCSFVRGFLQFVGSEQKWPCYFGVCSQRLSSKYLLAGGWERESATGPRLCLGLPVERGYPGQGTPQNDLSQPLGEAQVQMDKGHRRQALLRAPRKFNRLTGETLATDLAKFAHTLPPRLEAGDPKTSSRFLGFSPYLLDGSIPKHEEKALTGHQIIPLVPSWEVGHGPLSCARYLLGRENRLWESPGRPACGRQAPVTSAYPHRCLDPFPLAKAPSLAGHHLLPCSLGHMASTGSHPGRTQG